MAGLLLTLALASAVFSVIPPQYSSSGTAVLVRAKQPKGTPLIFDPSVNMAASVVVQALNAPQLPLELGLSPSDESFTARNMGSFTTTDTGSGQPFISVTALSSSPERSITVISLVIDKAQSVVAETEQSVGVKSSRNGIKIETIVSATPPKAVRTTQLRLVGVSVLLGIAATLALATLSERAASRRRRIESARFAQAATLRVSDRNGNAGWPISDHPIRHTR